MAEESTEGLQSSGEESSPSIYEGDLSPSGDESPKSDGSESTESPEISNDPGQSASQSGDSELDGIFTDLEKDIPEVLKAQAGNVKKKLQGYFTKKNQTISQEIETLKKSQITPELQRDYSTLYGWYEKLQKDPINGIRELASQLGMQPQAVVSALQGKPEEEEITPEYLASEQATRADFAKYARQEALKAAEAVRAKEVKPLQESLSTLVGGSTKRDNIERGQRAVEEAAKTLPGFVDDKGQITKTGNEAIASVLRGEFTGPEALQRAHYYLVGRNAPSKVKQLETELVNLKKNVRGATNTLGGQSPNTTMKPSSPESFWSDMKSEPLA